MGRTITPKHLYIVAVRTHTGVVLQAYRSEREARKASMAAKDIEGADRIEIVPYSRWSFAKRYGCPSQIPMLSGAVLSCCLSRGHKGRCESRRGGWTWGPSGDVKKSNA